VDQQDTLQATRPVDFYPWERSMPDRLARPSTPFVPFDEAEIEGSITRRFARIVDLYRERLAVQGSDRSFTYEALDQAANRVAWTILEEGKPGYGERAPIVAVLFEHGAWAIAALMGVIKAGKAYMPLDSTYPRARLEYMLQDSQADVILTHGENLALANELAGEFGQGRCRVINVEALSPDLPTEDPALEISPDAYAYLLYTSGTTGQPKGVLGSHRQVLHFSSVFINTHHICPEGRMCMISTLCFSGSLAYIFPGLLSGSALFPYDLKREGVGRLAKWLREERITYYGGVPTVFRASGG